MSEVMARWVPVPGFPSYEISDEGQVRSLRFDPPKIISQREKSTGYLVVALPSRASEEVPLR